MNKCSQSEQIVVKICRDVKIWRVFPDIFIFHRVFPGFFLGFSPGFSMFIVTVFSHGNTLFKKATS
jgi:hypothetical protein